ncbi:hypothetical protein HHK36_018979 [Tetracentron sinense]|uniref:Uncharacterized protein n=1 Tax=Tetracentron sinense TaxID=13715 RepID=A0A834YWU8_TETSI|nr:hypothetical protein HHK36_018979 [Tetracentron sinense]
MSGLKVIMVSSICSNSYKMNKLVRRISNSSGTATTRKKTPVALRSSSAERISVGLRDGRRLISCAYFGTVSDKGSGTNKGFRCKKPLWYSSSETKEGPGVVAAMDSENEEVRDLKNHLRPQEQQPQTLLTLPTILTLGRVAAVPLLVSTFYMNSWWGTTATTSIFIAAAITDWLDGYIARKMRLGTAFGAFLDPVADKLMVAATLILLCTKPLEVAMFGQVPWLLTVPSIAIIGREITMSAVREWAASQNSKVLEAVAVSNLGKWKTATQMTALTILLATRDSSLAGLGFLVATGVVLLYISAGLAVWSLVVYMRKIWRILLK